MKLIKYNNRKIYSRELRRYVNHDELINYLRDGNDFEVENKDGQDVTDMVKVEVANTYLRMFPKKVNELSLFKV